MFCQGNYTNYFYHDKLIKDIRFVHSLQIDSYNSHPDNKGKIDNLVALMENKENGTRSYKISRTTPDGLSYARDIANRYGLDLKGILGIEGL